MKMRSSNNNKDNYRGRAIPYTFNGKSTFMAKYAVVKLHKAKCVERQCPAAQPLCLCCCCCWRFRNYFLENYENVLRERICFYVHGALRLMLSHKMMENAMRLSNRTITKTTAIEAAAAACLNGF